MLSFLVLFSLKSHTSHNLGAVCKVYKYLQHYQQWREKPQNIMYFINLFLLLGFNLLVSSVHCFPSMIFTPPAV